MYRIQDQEGIIYNVADTIDAFSQCNEDDFQLLADAIEIIRGSYQKAAEMYSCGLQVKILVSDSNEKQFLVTVLPDSTMTGIIVCVGLLRAVRDCILMKYSDAILEKLFPDDEKNDIRAKIYNYAVKFLALHELFHIWHGHDYWATHFYYTDPSAPLKGNGRKLYQECKPLVYRLSDNDRQAIEANRDKFIIVLQYNITQQAMEADADRTALGHLANSVVNEMKALPIGERNTFAIRELSLLEAGLCIAAYIFSNNDRREYSFESIPKDIAEIDHPTPAIRFFMGDRQIRTVIRMRIKDSKIRNAVFQKIEVAVEDVEREYAQEHSLSYAFFDLAYCENSQKSARTIMQRYNNMWETLKEAAESDLEPKYSEELLKPNPEYILFDALGNKLV